MRSGGTRGGTQQGLHDRTQGTMATKCMTSPAYEPVKPHAIGVSLTWLPDGAAPAGRPWGVVTLRCRGALRAGGRGA
ncbi:hypothetical protein CJO92_22255 (plasmid) [Ralstonia solanacearum]|uniref:Uncharacterized protein n=1 Tax=Ralstonia solanacearum TaxID=305 RepID=A0AAD0SCZ6_RALSL|nr:hypothetical protein CJO77_22245 [Ralstonia solanacearum]AXW55893.1 hypothetical protein CJO92_22255 [Ralstonia solanacearum]